MALKRKRSELISCNFPPTVVDGQPSTNSLLLSQSSTINEQSPKTPLSRHDPHIGNGYSSPVTTQSLSSHTQLHTQPTPHFGRTLKRHRDDRPDEAEVYAHTIAKLYSAQNPHQEQAVSITHDTLMDEDCMEDMNSDSLPAQTSTLHTFWNLPQPHNSITEHEQLLPPSQTNNMSCEHCEREIKMNSEHIIYDIEQVKQDKRCNNCGKIACDLCAVRGDTRICLDCTT